MRVSPFTPRRKNSTRENNWRWPAGCPHPCGLCEGGGLPVTRSPLSRLMRPEKRMDLAHCQRNPLFGLFPREDAHFSFRREHRAFHGGGVGVRRHVVRQDQDRVLATPYEIARHGEDEVGI